MGIVIGIDVGGSTTKIIGIEKNELRHPMLVRAEDPVTSLFGALGKYIYDNGIQLSDIEKVMLTGVGSAYVEQDLYGLPTLHTDEFLANGLGASYGLDLNELIVVSMGTGTSFVQVQDGRIRHIGGIGIGGGTIAGLSRLMLKNSRISQVVEMASQGDVGKIDLQIRDICNRELPGLPLDITASTFGKADLNVSDEDIAAGIIHMVLEHIGQSVVLAALNSPIQDFVLIGNLAKLPQCPRMFQRLEQLHGCRFHIPEHAEYRTALGAALAGKQEACALAE